MKTLTPAVFALLFLTACNPFGGGGGGDKEVDRFDVTLAPIVGYNSAYMTVLAAPAGQTDGVYYLFRHDTARKTYEWESCSNHATPTSGQPAVGQLVNVAGDLNAIEDDTGAILALDVFFHNPNCVTNRITTVVQDTRELPL